MSMWVDDLECFCMLSELGRYRKSNLHVCYRYQAVCKIRVVQSPDSNRRPGHCTRKQEYSQSLPSLFLIVKLSQREQLRWPQWR